MEDFKFFSENKVPDDFVSSLGDLLRDYLRDNPMTFVTATQPPRISNVPNVPRNDYGILVYDYPNIIK